MPLPRRWFLAVFALLFGFSIPSANSGRAQQADGKAVFTRLCAACHGPIGAGDGPAAAALKPHPPSFADPQFQTARTDSQLVASITNGKPPMPPFGKQLTVEQIRALVAYIRTLRQHPKAS